MLKHITSDPVSDDRYNRDIRLLPQDRLYRVLLDPLLPKKLRPNHLTVLRIFLAPFTVYFLYIGEYGIGVPMFLFAALTDTLDGSMARVRRQITRWGIIYDPLADKLLIGAVLFIIVLRHINFWLGMALILAEAAMIVGAWFRIRRGRVTSADFWGKLKMFAEVVGIMLLLVALWSDISLLVDLSVGTLAVALAVAIVGIMSRLHA